MVLIMKNILMLKKLRNHLTSERGATIAKSADEHAIDAERLDQAWPQQVKPDKQS